MNGIVRTLMCVCLASAAGCASLPGKSFPAFGQNRAVAMERSLSMARLMERNHKYDEAARIYQSILEKQPKHEVANHRMGILAVRRGEHDQALDYFEKAKGKNEPSAALLSDIGYTYYLKHDLETAERELRSAVKRDPQLKAARTNLGLVFAEQGRDEEALAEFRKAVDEADALANLAFVQTKMGRFDVAEKNYHRALAIDPKQRQAAEAIVQFEVVRNKGKVLMSRLEKESTEQAVASQKSSEKVVEVAATVTRPEPKPTANEIDPATLVQTVAEVERLPVNIRPVLKDSPHTVTHTSFEWAEELHEAAVVAPVSRPKAPQAAVPELRRSESRPAFEWDDEQLLEAVGPPRAAVLHSELVEFDLEAEFAGTNDAEEDEPGFVSLGDFEE